MMRWGMPTSQRAMMGATNKRARKLEEKSKSVDYKQLLRMELDSGVMSIRS